MDLCSIHGTPVGADGFCEVCDAKAPSVITHRAKPNPLKTPKVGLCLTHGTPVGDNGFCEVCDAKAPEKKPVKQPGTRHQPPSVPSVKSTERQKITLPPKSPSDPSFFKIVVSRIRRKRREILGLLIFYFLFWVFMCVLYYSESSNSTVKNITEIQNLPFSRELGKGLTEDGKSVSSEALKSGDPLKKESFGGAPSSNTEEFESSNGRKNIVKKKKKRIPQKQSAGNPE